MIDTPYVNPGNISLYSRATNNPATTAQGQDFTSPTDLFVSSSVMMFLTFNFDKVIVIHFIKIKHIRVLSLNTRFSLRE